MEVYCMCRHTLTFQWVVAGNVGGSLRPVLDLGQYPFCIVR
ncbi:hypothetical protein WI0192307A02_CDS0074 [Pseudomonas phage KG853]